jgi:DDE superfamily endonuclease/Helix-turn-helix of DDE superfamily endonuclease
VPRLFSAARLRRSASFRRLTGVSVTTFDQMLRQLRDPWDAAQRSKSKSGRPWEVGGLEDHLLIMLLYYRCYVTQEFLGFFYQVDRSVICRAIQRIETHVKPAFAVRRKPKISRQEAEALIIDCTEQPIQRPRDNATQEEHYSGKRKCHTLKTEYIITGHGRIASVSTSHPGSRHDLTIRREGTPLPKKARGYADSAYQGYDKEHPNLDIPYKKPKGGELTEEEKDYNRGLSSFRVAVEHRIGRTKRFRIVSDRFRNPRRTHHTKTSIIAGLVNIEAGIWPF